MVLLCLCGTAILTIGYISNNVVFPEPLSIEEEKHYIDEMEKGNKKAKEILIERNLRLVAHVCKKYSTTNVDQDDLISIGSIGLIKGINSFDSKKNIKLSTYTSRCIDNEILMYLRSTKKLGAEVYLNETIGKDKDDNEVTLQEVLENNDKSIEDIVDLKLDIAKLYSKMEKVLDERERYILVKRYGLDGYKSKTQKEIAKEMGISRSYVSRIETKAISKLSNAISN